MKNRLALCVMLAVIVAVPLAAQTIRIGAIAASSASDADVLVLHEVDALGKPYGTMPMRYVTEIRQRASSVLDIGIVEPAFNAVYLTRDDAIAVSRGDSWRPALMLRAGEATFNAMSLLQIRPALGRDFAETDVQSGRHVALLTAGAWQRLFASRTDAVGKLVWTWERGQPPHAHEVIGILPAGILSATPELDPELDVLLLAQTAFETPGPEDRAFAPVVRLKPGVTLDAATGAINAAVTAAQRALGPRGHAGGGARLDTLRR